MQGEISYDLVMDDDMSFVEGNYRLGTDEWNVFIFSKRAIEKPSWQRGTWESGAAGIVFHVPHTMILNTARVECLMSEALGVETWQRTKGPDSMVLR